jgi:hypothetical protein
MPSGIIPKYRHYKPKDLAVVRIDGRDHYLGKYGTPESKEKYARLLAEHSMMGSVALPAVAPTEEKPFTILELIEGFRTHAEGYYRRADGTRTGEQTNYKHAFRPLKALFGRTPARDFGPKSLKLVRQRMIDSGLSRTVINRYGPR